LNLEHDPNMAFLRKTLKPLGHAAHLFFRSQLRLQVRGGLRVEFTESGATPSDNPAARAAAARRAEFATMVGELAQCLDADPDIRPELRHLAYLETALLQQGLLALDAVPLDVLQRALDQFEGLVSNWAPRGLATLRSKMAVALSERSVSGTGAAGSTRLALSDPPA
jgi:hypothetical protein